MLLCLLTHNQAAMPRVATCLIHVQPFGGKSSDISYNIEKLKRVSTVTDFRTSVPLENAISSELFNRPWFLFNQPQHIRKH